MSETDYANEGKTPHGGVDSPPDTTPQKTQAGDTSYSAAHANTDRLKTLKSPGVARVEALAAAITFKDRIFIFLSVFLVAYAYGLDGTARYAYQPVATASFGHHSLSATINVVKSVIAAAAQPTAAKIADVFGRVELICVSVFFYVLGTVIEAAATNVATYAGGTILYQIGYTMILLLVEVIIADITSTRSRLLFSFIPASPFIINTWVSGNVTSAVLKATTWQWGVGMWCIIYPVCAMPLIISLSLVGRRAKKEGHLQNYRSSFEILGYSGLVRELFWMLDVIGLILVIAIFGLILVPLTLAGGFHSKWQSGDIIAPLVVGVACIPAFIFWELRAPHPLVPFALLKDRGVWAALCISFFLFFAWVMQGDYLYTVLIVAFDFDVKTATRVLSLYSFVSTIVGSLLGFVVFKVRRLKPFIMFGSVVFLVAFGLLIRYRGGKDGGNHAGVIAGQVVLGFGAGFFSYPTQASLQAGLKHEHLAVMTGLYLATFNVGSAVGNTVSGALWTQLLPQKLEQNFAGVNSTLAVQSFASPFSVAAAYPLGTPERDALVESYQYIQRLLCITGIALCVPLIGFACALRNRKLNDQQTLAKDSDSESSVAV